MAPRSIALLWDMRTAANLAHEFLGSTSLEAYREDPLLRSAVERQLQNLGEALVQLEKADAMTALRIPEHRQVIGTRNVLVHGYAAVRDDRIWNTVIGDLPPPMQGLGALLAETDLPPASP